MSIRDYTMIAESIHAPSSDIKMRCASRFKNKLQYFGCFKVRLSQTMGIKCV